MQAAHWKNDCCLTRAICGNELAVCSEVWVNMASFKKLDVPCGQSQIAFVSCIVLLHARFYWDHTLLQPYQQTCFKMSGRLQNATLSYFIGSLSCTCINSKTTNITFDHLSLILTLQKVDTVEYIWYQYYLLSAGRKRNRVQNWSMKTLPPSLQFHMSGNSVAQCCFWQCYKFRNYFLIEVA